MQIDDGVYGASNPVNAPMKSLIAALMLAIAFAGSTTMAATAPRRYVSDKTIDYWGYYRPLKPTVFGEWKLEMLILDPPKDFRDFEAGTARAGQSADSTPFAIHFQTTIPGKLGASGFLAAITVDPTTYRVTGDTVSFTGDGKALGVVTFEGAFSPRFFKTISSNRSAKNSNAIVLTGTLRADGKSLPVSFTWFDGGPD